MRSLLAVLLRALVAFFAIGTFSQPARGQAVPRSGFHERFVALANEKGLSDSTRLHRLFALDWEYTNVEYPEFATYSGYPGQNHRWTDLSIDALMRRRRELNDYLPVFNAIDRARLNLTDQLSYDILLRQTREGLEGQRFPSELLQVNQRGGPQYLSDVLAQQPAATVSDYNDILARLRALPAVVDQTIALIDSGLKRGITPPRVTLRDIPKQVEGLTPDDAMKSPLLEPFTRMPASIAQPEQQRLKTAAVEAYAQHAKPAFRRFHSYLTTKYLTGARETLAASALPDGQAWYAYNVKIQTTTGRSPAEIHQIGLSEVKRIRGQMDSVIKSTGFTGDFAAFVTMLRTDPRFFYKDSASLVRGYRDVAKRIDPELTKLFGKLPRLPYGVSTIPSYASPSQTTAYYQQGSPEAHRAGLFTVNTYKLEMRPMWEMEALTIHEAVPGHHLQIALSQELEGIPEFRRYGGYTAFVEGWALYSESLGAELGMYRDPYAKFGQLTYEMWRAIRLVLDPGIHSMGWTRQQAIDYFKANSAKTEQDIIQEVDRYIVWPGQALAYKSGELKIKELRAFAERELGSRFDIRAFHDEVLSQGGLPLDVLDARIRAWVSARRAGTPVATGSMTPATPTSSSDSLAVVRVIDAYDRALQSGDSTAAIALLAPGAVILESGGAESLLEYKSHHLPADIAFARAVRSQRSALTVKVTGDIAWAWSTSITRGQYRGRTVNSNGAELMVLTRGSDGWKISAIHWSSRERKP